jgi:succinate dehydrogenase / fumarate reductase iron-sulfur subunit
MQTTYQLTLNIRRFDPETGRSRVHRYSLAAGRILRFVDLLRKINDQQDPTLTWNSSCEHGQCGTCSMRVNGKPLLACELLVENAVAYFGTTTFDIEPLDVAPVVRDLAVNTDTAYERVNQVKPYLITPADPPDGGRAYGISPAEMAHYVNATRCINCFCCVAACVSSHQGFLGPNAMLASIVRMMDPREQEKKARQEIIYGDQGVARCHTAQACSFVCPKEIDVAHFIALAKEGRFKPPSTS